MNRWEFANFALKSVVFRTATYFIVGAIACQLLTKPRPEFTPSIHLRIQPEIVVQGLLMSEWFAYWLHPRSQPKETNLGLTVK